MNICAIFFKSRQVRIENSPDLISLSDLFHGNAQTMSPISKNQGFFYQIRWVIHGSAMEENFLRACFGDLFGNRFTILFSPGEHFMFKLFHPFLIRLVQVPTHQLHRFFLVLTESAHNRVCDDRGLSPVDRLYNEPAVIVPHGITANFGSHVLFAEMA